MRDNSYPAGVYETMAGAPWNEPDGFICNGCGEFCQTSERRRGRNAPASWRDEPEPPKTKFGQDNELCASCEYDHSKCAECGEWYQEWANGSADYRVGSFTVEPSTARHCEYCADDIAPDAPAVVEYRAHFYARPKPCAHCGNAARYGYAYTNGRTAPASWEYVPFCASCVRTSTADVLRGMFQFYREPFDGSETSAERFYHCGDCNAPAEPGDAGTVCNVCGRGIIREPEKGGK